MTATASEPRFESVPAVREGEMLLEVREVERPVQVKRRHRPQARGTVDDRSLT